MQSSLPGDWQDADTERVDKRLQPEIASADGGVQPEFIREAAERGIFAHISDDDVEDWQSSIDIVLRRFAEYHELQGAFGRRATIERAKGILMERHSIGDAAAFELLREQSRTANR